MHDFLIRNIEPIIISSIGTLVGMIFGLVITLFVSRYYSKRSQLQLQENVVALLTEIRQVFSAVRHRTDLGACLHHNDKGMPKKWLGEGQRLL